MKSLRSDRGTHFVNEVITEFCLLFNIPRVLTIAERPQANGIAERNGAEVMRHLRALVFDKQLQNIWSVVLPMVMRIINNAFKHATGTVPNRLLFLCPPDPNRNLFSSATYVRNSQLNTQLPLSNEFIVTIRDAYERLLDLTSDHVMETQEMLREAYKVPIEEAADFEVGSYVLWSVLSRSDKLAAMWRGPYEVMSRSVNTFVLRDLTNDALHDADIHRLRQFFVEDPNAPPPVAIAAANLSGEVEVDSILNHRGHPAKRKEMTFLVLWRDNSESWEPWQNIKKLAALDDYIALHPPLNRLRSK